MLEAAAVHRIGRMDEVVVLKRFYVDGGDGDKCYLSLLSSQDFSPIPLSENLYLPPHIEDEYVSCSSCGPLLYLDDFQGNTVLCNLAAKQLKFLPRPTLDAALLEDSFEGSGLGYDSKSDDYKVIRKYCEIAEVYSLKSGVWKTIPSPLADVSSQTGVYINGSCYWIANFGDTSFASYDIVSFDFTTESFNRIHSPPKSGGEVFDVVEYHGLLGAIVFRAPWEGISTKSFKLWVWEESWWSMVFDVVLSGVGGLWSMVFVTSVYSINFIARYL